MGEKYVIGIDAGGTKVAYGLFSSDGTLVSRRQHPTDAAADGPGFSDTVIENIRELMDQHALSFDSLLGVGLCMPSFILYDEGRILMTSAMPGIKDFPMRDYLRERMPTRIVLDNDSNAAALAEYRFGAGRGARHMVYVSISTGLGSGIIIDGKLFRGTYGWAGECGHMLATPDQGQMCGCENRGCFMSYASGNCIPAYMPGASGVDLLQAYQAGDAVAVGLVEQMARYLAVCVFNMYQMLNIGAFVFGGGLVHFGQALFGRMRQVFERYNHIPLPVHFKMAELKSDFGVIGAAEFVRER